MRHKRHQPEALARSIDRHEHVTPINKLKRIQPLSEQEGKRPNVRSSKQDNVIDETHLNHYSRYDDPKL